MREGIVSERLEFQLLCKGYDPRFKNSELKPLALKDDSTVSGKIEVEAESFAKIEKNFVTNFFPPTLPKQTYAPLPNAGCALSVEVLDFGRMPLNAVQTKVIALVNYTTDQTLFFQWNDRNLFRGRNEILAESEFQIIPQSGVLEPGSHQIVIFRFASVHGPVDVSGELECQIDWITARQVSQLEREYLMANPHAAAAGGLYEGAHMAVAPEDHVPEHEFDVAHAHSPH
jgi:hypothetical protein